MFSEDKAITDERHHHSARHHKGEAGVERPKKVQKILHLGRISHAANDEAESKDKARDEAGRDPEHCLTLPSHAAGQIR